MSTPKSVMKKTPVKDWCRLCGNRSYRCVCVWYPDNAEHDEPVKPGYGVNYVRICLECSQRISKVAMEPCQVVEEK